MSASPLAGEQRIIGGTERSIWEFPHLASLRYNHRHVCGATIISPVHLLIAAQCDVGAVQDMYSVVAGVSYLNGPVTNSYPVKSFIAHKQYNPATLAHDIAVLVLLKPLDLSTEKIRAAMLPLPNERLPVGNLGFAAGW